MASGEELKRRAFEAGLVSSVASWQLRFLVLLIASAVSWVRLKAAALAMQIVQVQGVTADEVGRSETLLPGVISQSLHWLGWFSRHCTWPRHCPHVTHFFILFFLRRGKEGGREAEEGGRENNLHPAD